MIVRFSSARALASRADSHFVELRKNISLYKKRSAYEVVNIKLPVSRYEERRVKIKSPIPIEIPCITFDIVNGLRSSLDHAVYESVQFLTGKESPESTKFPFGDSYSEAEAQFGGEGKGVPASIRDTLLDFGPYPNGDRLLWGFNKLRNRKIHRSLAPLLFRIGGMGIGTQSFGHIGELTTVAEWNEDQSEFTFMRGRNIDDSVDISFDIDVGFDKSLPLEGESLIDVLRHVSGIVQDVTIRLESEVSRILLDRSKVGRI